MNIKFNQEFNVVLIEPEIPQNTGNVGRTCVGLGISLHLVGKLGFSLDSSYLKRAGLDYWDKLSLQLHPNWDVFYASVPKHAEICFFSTHGTHHLWEQKFRKPLFLIFGSESKGFSKAIYRDFSSRLIRIPIGPNIRSLNLATAVGVAVFEAQRQFTYEH